MSENKSDLIYEEPEQYRLKKTELALLAAAHKLAADNGLDIPKWVSDEKYIMKKPAYAFNTKNKEYQRFLKETSPKEYSSRNLFYGNNVLKRV